MRNLWEADYKMLIDFKSLKSLQKLLWGEIVGDVFINRTPQMDLSSPLFHFESVLGFVCFVFLFYHFGFFLGLEITGEFINP